MVSSISYYLLFNQKVELHLLNYKRLRERIMLLRNPFYEILSSKFYLISLELKPKNYCFNYFPRIALIPGRTFPSMYSNIAPPPVET